jgi:hypothetical protein
MDGQLEALFQEILQHGVELFHTVGTAEQHSKISAACSELAGIAAVRAALIPNITDPIPAAQWASSTRLQKCPTPEFGRMQCRL